MWQDQPPPPNTLTFLIYTHTKTAGPLPKRAQLLGRGARRPPCLWSQPLKYWIIHQNWLVPADGGHDANRPLVCACVRGGGGVGSRSLAVLDALSLHVSYNAHTWREQLNCLHLWLFRKWEPSLKKEVRSFFYVVMWPWTIYFLLLESKVAVGDKVTHAPSSRFRSSSSVFKSCTSPRGPKLSICCKSPLERWNKSIMGVLYACQSARESVCVCAHMICMHQNLYHSISGVHSDGCRGLKVPSTHVLLPPFLYMC